jgi:hypothetical protein
MLGNALAPMTGLVMAPQNEGGTTGDSADHAVAPDSGAVAANAAAQGTPNQGAPNKEAAPSRGAAPSHVARETAARHGRRSNDASPPPPAAAAKPAAGPAESWRHDMAAGDKSFLKTLDRFDSPAALAKAYKELTAKLSSGELKAMKPPGEHATPEALAAWRIDHGLPENTGAYVAGLALPDGTVPGETDQPMLANFAELAMKGNWTAQQYNDAVGWYFAMQDHLAAERQMGDAAFKAQASSDLMREWGTDYALNRNAVAQFFDRNFPSQFKIEVLNARLPDGRILANDPAFNKAMLELAKMVNPAGAVLPNVSGGALSNVESRIGEIETKYMRAAHGSDAWKSYWSGDSGVRMQQEYRSLVASREQARRGAGG